MGLAWVWVPALAWVIRIAHADAALDVTPEAESEQDDFGLLQTNLISGMHLKGDEAIKSESGIGVEEEQRDAAVFTLFPLPYDYNGLEPFIDTETMFYHHDKHHQTYIDKLNAEIEGDLSAADVISWSTLLVNILKSTGAEDTAFRHYAGGVWNHYHLWLSLSPSGPRDPKDLPNPSLANAIDESFGSFEGFKQAWYDEAYGLFGSGFTWLVVKNGKLQIISTANQDNPLMPFIDAGIPILGIDVWEHAYYLLHRNLRDEYIEAWWNVVHWTQVLQWYDAAMAGQIPDVSRWFIDGKFYDLDTMPAYDPPPGLALYQSKAHDDKRVHLGDVMAMNATSDSDAFYKLPPLPYACDALEPHLDKETMALHHNKHHQVYIDKLNAAVTDHQAQSLLQLVQGAEVDVIRNNAAGAWNHGFFWLSMAPADARGVPSSNLMAAINSSFGSLEALKGEFKAACAKGDGESWAWLVATNQTLQVISTRNQDNPLQAGSNASPPIPILGLDVSEHAYYLKHKNRRAAYINSWWNVVNWNQVNKWYSDALLRRVPEINARPR